MDSRNDPPKSASLTFIHYRDLNMVCVTYRSIVIGILGCTVALLGAGCMNAGHLRGGETFLCDPLVVFSDCCCKPFPFSALLGCTLLLLPLTCSACAC